jgi:hypothetical protein
MDPIAANAIADALDALSAAIRTCTALPGEASPSRAKSVSKAKTTTRRSGKPKASVVKTSTPRKSTARKTPAKPKAARKSPVVEAVMVVEPGNLTLATPKGKAKPSDKQTVRRRFTLTWLSPDGEQVITHRTKFRFFRKAEAAADLLRNKGIDVTITPVNVPFTRRSKTSRQKRAAVKAAA